MRVRAFSLAFAWLPAVALVSGCSSSAPVIDAPAQKPDPKEADLKARVDRYATPSLTADISKLPESEKKALDAIIEASRHLDVVFTRQAWAGNPLALKNASGQALRYLKLMRGPWDRQDHFHPVVIGKAHPKGAGFYPVDMTMAEFRAHIKAHPEDKEAFESLVTVIERKDGKLVATPYSKFFSTELSKAAAALKKAAAATSNASLKTFLLSRAASFLSDDYYQSDKDWMDLNSAVEVTIGPYEIYEDELMGLKASFESFVTVSDPKASAQLAKFKGLLPDMEKNLPLPPEMASVRGGESPIRVVDLVFTAGDARKSVQTIAFNLPNDERVRQEKGAKKVMLRNAIETKFETIMRPIASEILNQSQLVHLDAKAFFDEVLFHELSHSMGPAYVKNDEKNGEVRMALGSSYSAIEECKADVMGVYNILYLIQRNEFPAAFREKLLVSYFAGLFRSVRFGVNEAHGKGAAVQINRYLEGGGATWDASTKRFTVHLDKLQAANKKLLIDLCTFEHNGDKVAVDAFLGQYGVMSAPMATALKKVDGVPTDIRPVFPLAGEVGDPLSL